MSTHVPLPSLEASLERSEQYKQKTGTAIPLLKLWQIPIPGWLEYALLLTPLIVVVSVYGSERDNVKNWDPSTIMDTALYTSIGSLVLFGMFAVFGSAHGQIFLTKSSLLDYLVAFLSGPAAIVFVLGTLLKVVSQMMLVNPDEGFEKCQSPLGYCSTISCVCANLVWQGYVFMFVTITVNAYAVTSHLPTSNFASMNKHLIPSGFLSYISWSHLAQAVLMRIGLLLTCLTAMIPDVNKGASLVFTHEALASIHSTGIADGLACCVVVVLWYVINAKLARLHVYGKGKPMCGGNVFKWLCTTHKRNFGSFSVGYIAWIMVTLGFFWALSFNGYDSTIPDDPVRANQCLVRKPELDCNLPTSFDQAAYETEYLHGEPMNRTECILDKAGFRCMGKRGDCDQSYDQFSVNYALEYAALISVFTCCHLFVGLQIFDADLWGVNDDGVGLDISGFGKSD